MRKFAENLTFLTFSANLLNEMINLYIINMVEYKCEKCKKTFKKKDDYKDHQNRKTPCDSNINSNECIHCGIKYSTKGSVTRHIKNGCSVFNAKEKEKQEIFDELLRLKQENERITNEMKELKVGLVKRNQSGGGAKINAQNNIHNGNIHNGNVNNITVVAFGKEKMDTIDKKSILDAVSKGINSAVLLTKNIHFNPNNPEYHNVYIPNLQNGYAMINDGSQWNLAPREEVINDLYRDKRDYVEEKMDTFKESLSKYKIEALERWLAIEDDDDATIKKIKEKIELLLYNERNIIKNNII
jgi:hypothetical protein